jgi:hypothetical protein
MTPQQYIAILRSSFRLELSRFQLVIAEREYTDRLRGAGLDPTKPLRYDDDALEITQVAQDGPQQ